MAQISEWEQNWLFKRRKQLLKARSSLSQSVPMLVPNPTEEGMEPRIGDEKASDLSDMSDTAVEDNDDEVGFSSSEEEILDEIIVTETTQTPIMASSLMVSAVENQVSTNIPKEIKETSGDKKTASNISSPQKSKGKVQEKEKVRVILWPQNCDVEAGTTARFSCTVSTTDVQYSKFINEKKNFEVKSG